MMRNLFYLSAILLLLPAFQSCQQTSAFSNRSNEEPTGVSAEHLVMSVLYQQRAAEYRALCYQAFNIATLRVDENLRQMGLSKQQAVVVDIDETVLDNSPHEAKCILNNSLYPAYWEEWVNQASARPVPGSLEFLKYVNTKRVEVFYITNRKEKYREQTLQNLMELEFPNADNEHLMMKTDLSSKKGRRDEVSEKYNIILLIGDNLNDFSEIFEELSVEERFVVTDKMSDKFGSRFIVLPNAMYGDWEGALYQYDYAISPDEKSEIRHERLIGF
jgi:5'-nucleotidase (lipoprotein e(P4) family)